MPEFDSIFLQETIDPLKGKNGQLNVYYSLYNDTDILESIEIQNLKSVDEFNTITSNMLDLLSELKETVITSKIERKFYNNQDKLLSIISLLDFNRVIITFVNPNKLNIQMSSEPFKEMISNKIVRHLKEDNQKLKTSFDFYNDTDIIESIEILNVESIKDYNFICEKIMDLLTKLK
jgi:hypothetical protein